MIKLIMKNYKRLTEQKKDEKQLKNDSENGVLLTLRKLSVS